MKKIALLLLLNLVMQPAMAASIYGLELAPQSKRENHLEHMFSLFEQFCLGQPSQEIARKNLEDSGRFELAKEYADVYEEHYESLSYAVSPDSDNCTVDVKLEYEKGRLLLSDEDVQRGMSQLAQYRLFKKEITTRAGDNAKQVLIAESTYYSDNKEKNKIELDYPLDNQDSYFMTLAYFYE